MKKALTILLCGCLLAAMPLAFAACDGEVIPAGELPDYELGDTWVWHYAMQGESTTLTEEVMGEEVFEGRDCYILHMSFDPVLVFQQPEGASTITSMKYWSDKATGIYEVKREVSGIYNGAPFTTTMVSTYDPWVSPFPLELGKQVETVQTLTSYFNGSQSGEPIVGTERYLVDSREEITVAAGTFDCWKLVIDDGAGNIIQTVWWSDEVRSIVKSVDADGIIVMELLSYSLVDR
jgi:hypothetical protein